MTSQKGYYLHVYERMYERICIENSVGMYVRRYVQ